jgi:hypothetical protein
MQDYEHKQVFTKTLAFIQRVADNQSPGGKAASLLM